MTHCCGDSSPGFALATAKLVFLFLFLLLSFSPHRHHFAQHDSAIIRLMPGEEGNETLNRGKR
jgi:hypothetical protein